MPELQKSGRRREIPPPRNWLNLGSALFDILTNATSRGPQAVYYTKSDRKFVAVDLAFYLPGQFDRTQPGLFGARTQKEVGGSG